MGTGLSDLVARLSVEHPTFVESLVSFIFTRPTSSHVISLQSRPEPCTCDLNDEYIRQLHGDLLRQHIVSTKAVRATLIPPDKITRYMAEVIFSAVLNGMVINLDVNKVSQIMERTQPRNKDRGYILLAKYIREDPRLVMQTASTWFVVTKVQSTMEFVMLFSGYDNMSLFLNSTVDALHPDFAVELVAQIDKLLEPSLHSRSETVECTALRMEMRLLAPSGTKR